MHFLRFIPLFAWLVFGTVFGDTDEAEPVSITNTGPVEIDQGSQTVSIRDGVEIHRDPFVLNADLLQWSRETDQLRLAGKVRLLADPQRIQLSEAAPLFAEIAEGQRSGERLEVLRTPELVMDLSNNAILPTGPAEVQIAGARIVGDGFALQLDSNRFSTRSYRSGFSSLFLEGDALQVEGPDLWAENAHFYWGEPDSFSFQGSAKSIEKQGESAVILRGITLKLGTVPFFYWPYYRHSLEQSRFSITGTAGYSGDLGAYTELRPAYHPTMDARWFADLQYFSKRGLLVGPGFDIDRAWASGHRLKTRMESGLLHDRSEPGFDALGEAIKASRSAVDFSIMHRYASSFHFISRIQHWSDSEFVRDFSPSRFRAIQQPESFVEAHAMWGSWVASLNTRFRHERFETTIERLPELSLTLLPSALPGTPFYHSAQLAFVQLRDRSPASPSDSKHTRIRGYYQSWYPLALTPWLDFTPQATAQRLSYRDISGSDSSVDRAQLELGFDLTAHAFAEWPLQSAVWNLQSLRHIVQPTLQVRYLEADGDSSDSLIPIEQRIFRTGIPDPDLSANSSLDLLDSGTLIRIGLRNALVAQRPNGRPQTWIDLDLFHDSFLFKDDSLTTEHSFALQAQLRPAHWLHLELQARADTDDLQMTDLFGRIQLIDGDIWDLNLASQFVRGQLQQYLLRFGYQLTENLRWVTELGYDQKSSRFYEQSYGVQVAISNFWNLEMNINLREGSVRNNRTRFEVRIRTARF